MGCELSERATRFNSKQSIRHGDDFDEAQRPPAHSSYPHLSSRSARLFAEQGHDALAVIGQNIYRISSQRWV